ncbi:hypothetical protein [Actinomadura oligospora]|uniref:hypothetical protein n=1 Tax=Actinomadura oligospora TaxID=111804 RepID=UPI00047904A9|nr:hypothetical protein [Actinomadura oligospora]
MGFWKTILGIARNRLIGPPVVVLGLGVGALVFVLTPVTYVSSSLLVLTTPSAGGLEDPNRPGWTTNPLLQFNDGLKTTAAILIQAAGTDDALAKMGVAKGGATKVVINDGTSNGKVMTASQTGPFIFVQVTSTREDEVTGVVHNAEQHLRDDLVNRQRTLGAPKQTYLMLTEVVPASSPVAQKTQKLEFSGAAFVAVVGLGFGIAYLGARRRALREAAAETPYDFYYGTTTDSVSLRPARRSALTPSPVARTHLEGDSSSQQVPAVPQSPNGSSPPAPNDYGLPLTGDPTETVRDLPVPASHENERPHDAKRPRAHEQTDERPDGGDQPGEDVRSREQGQLRAHWSEPAHGDERVRELDDAFEDDSVAQADRGHRGDRGTKARQGPAAFEILGAEAAARERETGEESEDAPAPRVR